jgi:azurin/HEAT repeat protein
MQNEFLNINVIGFQGIYRVKVTEDGSGLKGTTVSTPMLENDNAASPNVRPIAADVAPDGSLYWLDWHNPIIGHLQHNLRDPSRDHVHGRIYRITYPSRPLLTPKKIDGEPIAKLLELLKEPENNVRTRAKIELDKHDPKEVIAALDKWVKQFDPKSTSDAHHILEALWLHQWLNVVNEPLLREVLQSPEPRARAQAVRVLGYWRDRVSRPIEALKLAAQDKSPRVRLEAVRVASFFSGNDALEVAYLATQGPNDYYLDYTFKETAKQLSKSTKGFVPKDPRLLAVAVQKMSDKELAAAPNSEPILLARLERKTIDVNTRSAAIDELAKLHKADRATEVVAALKRLDEGEAAPQPVNDIALLLTVLGSDLEKQRNELQRLTSDTHKPTVRRAANAALVALDGKPDAAWQRTAGNPDARVILIESIPMLADPSARAQFQPLLVAALSDANTKDNVRAAALRALPFMGNDNAPKNFALLAARLSEGKDVPAVASAIKKLPRDSWAKDQAGPVTDAIATWAKSVPQGRRTEQPFVETIQVGMDMASLLPVADASRVRKQLLSMSVQVFAIKTVREQMRYDTPRIVVEQGKPFEIIFENDDMMPHNLVVVQPGAREEIGAKSDKMQPIPDRNGKLYIPNDKRILASTHLIEPGNREVLKMKPISQVGTNEFVCTFPEHWKNMWGQIVVVKDVEAFLQVAAPAPQQAAAAHDHNHAH